MKCKCGKDSEYVFVDGETCEAVCLKCFMNKLILSPEEMEHVEGLFRKHDSCKEEVI